MAANAVLVRENSFSMIEYPVASLLACFSNTLNEQLGNEECFVWFVSDLGSE